MFNDYYEYDICGHFLSAIMNGDYSGLEDDEEKQLNDFLDGLPAKNGVWDCPRDQEPSFVYCDVSSLYGECYRMRLWFTEAK